MCKFSRVCGKWWKIVSWICCISPIAFSPCVRMEKCTTPPSNKKHASSASVQWLFLFFINCSCFRLVILCQWKARSCFAFCWVFFEQFLHIFFFFFFFFLGSEFEAPPVFTCMLVWWHYQFQSFHQTKRNVNILMSRMTTLKCQLHSQTSSEWKKTRQCLLHFSLILWTDKFHWRQCVWVALFSVSFRAVLLN